MHRLIIAQVICMYGHVQLVSYMYFCVVPTWVGHSLCACTCNVFSTCSFEAQSHRLKSIHVLHIGITALYVIQLSELTTIYSVYKYIINICCIKGNMHCKSIVFCSRYSTLFQRNGHLNTGYYVQNFNLQYIG